MSSRREVSSDIMLVVLLRRDHKEREGFVSIFWLNNYVRKVIDRLEVVFAHNTILSLR